MSSSNATSPPANSLEKNNPTSMDMDDDGDDGDDDSPLLVSEFPPPPYYYRLAASTIKEKATLQPPEIPTEALERAAKKAASMAAAAKEIAERNRLQAANIGEGGNHGDNHDAISSTASETLSQVALGGAVPDLQSTLNNNNDEEEVVAVFGEIVEDPLLVKVEDDCEDPTKIRDEVSRLNNQVLQGFVKLVGELVYRPMDNKKFRDELSHNIFLMIQECNKFREHQARETLIDLLEKQLMERNKAVEELKEQIHSADMVLDKLKKIKGEEYDESNEKPIIDSNEII